LSDVAFALVALFGTDEEGLGGVMLNVNIENIGDLVVVECKGRIVQSEAAFKLRKAVTSQPHARIVVLDLTEVQAIEGGGLGMLWFLQRWAQDHDVRLKLFSPTNSVKGRLEHNNAGLRFDIATFEDMMALLADTDRQYGVAA
jgi:anti-anti-sigma regulatory factor